MAIDWKPTNEIVGRAEKWDFEIFPNDSGRITLFITSRVNGEITEGMECASVEEAKEKAQAWIEEYPHGTWKRRRNERK